MRIFLFLFLAVVLLVGLCVTSDVVHCAPHRVVDVADGDTITVEPPYGGSR